MQFYDALGITRDVASRPDLDVYGLRPFLSCKYLLITVATENREV